VSSWADSPPHAQDGQLISAAFSAWRPGALRRASIVAVGGTALFALLLSPFKLCLVARVFHVPCPGCGMTRAAVAMAHGDVAGAFALHPLSLVLVPLAIAVAAVQVARYVRTGSAWNAAPLSRGTELASAALVLLLLGVWVARLFGYFGGPVPV